MPYRLKGLGRGYGITDGENIVAFPLCTYHGLLSHGPCSAGVRVTILKQVIERNRIVTTKPSFR